MSLRYRPWFVVFWLAYAVYLTGRAIYTWRSYRPDALHFSNSLGIIFGLLAGVLSIAYLTRRPKQ